MKTMAKFVMLLVVLAFCLPADGEILIYTKTMKCFIAEGERVVDTPDWDWDWVGDERVTGYLILDVEYDENGEIIEIDDAEQVEYWREGRDKYYEQIEEWFEVERIETEAPWGPPIVNWVLENFWMDEGEGYEDAFFAMYRGKARLVNIGLGWTEEERREVPSALQGALQYYWEWLDEEAEPDVWELEKATCCVTLRLNSWWTRLANVYWDAYWEDGGEGWTFDPFEWAVGGITGEPYDIDGEEIEVEEDEPYGIVKAWLEWLGYEEDIDGMEMPL